MNKNNMSFNINFSEETQSWSWLCCESHIGDAQFWPMIYLLAYSDWGQIADWLSCLGVCFSKKTHMNFLRMFGDCQIIGILKLFTLSQNPIHVLYSIKQIIFSLSNCFLSPMFIAPYGCRFTDLWNKAMCGTVVHIFASKFYCILFA